MRTISFTCLLGVALLGCQGQSDIVGRWKYGRDLVDFRPDHTFVQKDPIGELDGMWMRSGDIVTLTPETAAGESLDQYRSKALRRLKKNEAKPRVVELLDQWLAIDRFKMNPDGITMDIVDPTGKRCDSLMRSL